MPRTLLYVTLLVGLTACGSLRKGKVPPKREFRGVWVATVANIDWPKSGSDNAEKQQADFLQILDFYHKLNFNAIIVQIRTAGDAFYPSKYAPWSRYLTGKEGKPPEWKEDPLTWMIGETKARGMEFHAWLNPYRATVTLDTLNLSPDHDYYQHPDWILTYGSKRYYNPGLPQVQDNFKKIIAEVVARYPVDAVHFDDYFYPYKVTGETLKDSATYTQYGLPGQTLEDWRRSNIDSLVKGVHQTIKHLKPWVQFGISPFGVWKNKTTDPKGSDTQAGQTTYEDLYADPLLWIERGWVQYLAPQLYWSMALPVAGHSTLANWWAKNANGTRLYIGNGAYKVRNNTDPAWEKKRELPNQIKLAREIPEVSGNILFSAKSLMQKNKDVLQYLKRKYYKHKALPPVPLEVSLEPLPNPEITAVEHMKDRIKISFHSNTSIKKVLVYKIKKNNREDYPIKNLTASISLEPNAEKLTFSKKPIKEKPFALVFLDNYGRESLPIIFDQKQPISYD